jgi:sigma-B regulation protein RsbU (phosphoserine phosphatase)
MGKILSPKGMVVLRKTDYTFGIEMVKGFSTDLVGATLEIKHVPKSLFYLDRVETRRYPWAKILKQTGTTILLPLLIGEKPIGLLGFGEAYSKKKLRSREETYLRSLGNISATAIEKNRTICEIEQVNRKLDQKVQELNTLFDLGKEFGALLDPDKLVRLLVFSLLGQIGVSRYLICLKDGPDMKVVASRLDGPTPQSELLTSLSKIKKPTVISDIMVKDATDPRDLLMGIGLRAIVPMETQSETKGLIILGEKLSRDEFSKADLEFLSSLANLAIISLENARLFKEAIEKQKLEDELMIAREIQKGLLPSVIPSIPGINIAATNVSSKQVGGDYYDVIPAREGKFMIAIGDVSGKGSPAALLMSNLQATIRTLVPFEFSLGDLTGRVNDLMCRNTGGTKFVTFFWGFIDPSNLTLNYVNAGHNYPFLVHADGSVDRLDKGGMILGVMKTSLPYEEATIHLRSNDLLLLFTDGVSEAMDTESVEYGEERLEALLRAHIHASAQEIIREIHRDVQAFSNGAPQFDDLTMMVVKVS